MFEASIVVAANTVTASFTAPVFSKDEMVELCNSLVDSLSGLSPEATTTEIMEFVDEMFGTDPSDIVFGTSAIVNPTLLESNIE